jgi:plastocyanin
MRKFVILAGILAFAVATTATVSAVGKRGTIVIAGDERFVANKLIESDFHFMNGDRSVKSGASLRWRNTTDDEHTITLVPEEDVPADFDEVFECRDPGGHCRAALDAHFATDPPTQVIDVGAAGLDTPGDSLLVEEGSVSAVISAPAGTELYYICSVHPWMQGEIEVE